MKLTCLVWGPLKGGTDHASCLSVVRDPDVCAVPLPATVTVPAVCDCECRTCHRAWWRAGRPRIVAGRVEREPGWTPGAGRSPHG